ncbi:MAG: hydrolase [Acetobacteraceae bacterium]|nr:hydrolase [Acetobacteraceae bacterium]
MHPPLSRRGLLALLGATPAAPVVARAQAAPIPILFLHGNGDHAALWMTTLWRFESNGWPRDRLRAVNLPDPLARDDDAVPQPNRSSSTEQTVRVADLVRDVLAETGAPRLALVGNSRGGNPIRDFVAHAGGASLVSHAVLCGTPNRGVFDWPERRNSEFNGRGDFLRRLNGGESDVVPGTAFLTLRSDNNDLYAQPRAIWNAAAPDRATGTDTDGPALRGATNLVLPGLDHREVAYHARAFAEIFGFIAGRAPERLSVTPELSPMLDGLVTGVVAGQATNRPVAGAEVQVFRTDPETGARLTEVMPRRTTGADGRWGPLRVAADWTLEFVLAVPGFPVAHIHRGPFPRGSSVVHLRPPRPLTELDRAAGGTLLFTRPRGYFGLPRDALLLDGRTPPEVPRGIARSALATLRMPPDALGRPIPCLFNKERIIARAWPAAENRISVAELTW